jgi:hypothetical protein
LHSVNPEKDQGAFEQALTTHREKYGDIFIGFVFPAFFTFQDAKFTGNTDFRDAEFSGDADFRGAEFSGNADFHVAKFGGYADFVRAAFSGNVNFVRATFSKNADFVRAAFSGNVNFGLATFSENANFRGAVFSGRADFVRATFIGNVNFGVAAFSRTANFGVATFSGDANFPGATFSKNADFRAAKFTQNVLFNNTKFLSRAIFASGKDNTGQFIPIFGLTETGAEIDFRDVIVELPDAIIFRDADLSNCRFLRMDLRRAEITNVIWRQMGHRIGVYDEYVLLEDKTDDWGHVETLYRQLKQKYEERKDYEAAGDFHYGEKEMRRRNPKTSRGIRFLLTSYWLVAGYGERYLRPLLCAGILLFVSMTCYLSPWFELKLKLYKGTRILDWTSGWGWLESLHYTLRTMLLLKPDDLATPLGYSKWIFLIDSVLGPILIALFALVIHQRLKR